MLEAIEDGSQGWEKARLLRLEQDSERLREKLAPMTFGE